MLGIPSKRLAGLPKETLSPVPPVLSGADQVPSPTVSRTVGGTRRYRWQRI